MNRDNLAFRDSIVWRAALALAVFCGLLLFFIPISLERLIAKDEGFYMLAARLVAEGKTPYLDFFYPQMPLLPYLYAAWMSIFGFDWGGARMFSALLSSLIGLGIYIYCAKRYGAGIAVFACVIFASSCFVFPWLSTAQTYAPSTCFLFFSVVFLACWQERSKILWLLLAGVFFGLAVDVRLPFAGLFPLFCVYVWYHTATARECVRTLALFGFGLGIALLPNLYFILWDFDRYYFNNLGYHFLRSDKPLEGDIKHKWKILKVLLGIDPSQKFEGIQYLLLVVGALCSTLWLKKKTIPFALFIGLGLFGLNFLPKPSYVQYFCTTVPFFTVAFAATLFHLSQLLVGRGRTVRFLAGSAFIAFLVLYLFHIPINLEKYTRTGEGVIGIQNEVNAKNWSLRRVSEVATAVAAIAPAGSKVLAWWPGYLLELELPPYPRSENHFGILVGDKVGKDRRLKYRIFSKEEMLSEIAKAGPDVLILNSRFSRKAFEKALGEGNYLKAGELDSVRWYLKHGVNESSVNESGVNTNGVKESSKLPASNV